MAEYDGAVLAGPLGNVEPRLVAGRGARASFLGCKLHLARGRAESQARQSVDDYPQALNTAQAAAPLARFIAVHLMHESLPVGTGQHSLHLGRAGKGFCNAPLGQDTGMNQKMIVLKMCERLSSQPIGEFIAVVSAHQLVERI